MQIILDTDTITSVLGGSGASIAALVGILWKKGYIKIWITKLTTSLDEIMALKEQNGNALTKLNTPDDIMCVLNSFEINERGQVVLKDHGRVNTLLLLERPLTEAEKDEVIRAVKKVLITCEG